MKVTVLIENTACGAGVLAEHGLSLSVQTARHHVLFDAGASSAFAENAQYLGVDLRTVDMAVLSHGHYDHSGGMLRFLELNGHAPLLMSRYAPEPHFNAAGKDIGVSAHLAGHPRVVALTDDYHEDAEISLHTRMEADAAVPSYGQTMLQNGAHVPDDYRHELYMLVREGGRRVLFSGCSHRGILNIVRWFRPDVLVGGFHFMKLNPEQEADAAYLEAAAQELLRYGTQYYTCHCTGKAAFAFLKARMGERLQLLSGGQRLEI